MARRSLRLRFLLESDTRGATQGLDRFRGSLSKVGGLARAGLAVGVGAAAAAITAFGVAVKAGVGAAREQEEALNRLNSAFSGLTDTPGEAVSEFQKFTAEVERLTTVGDEAAQNAGALILEIGKSPETLSQATQAAIDLSAALGIGLEEAAKQVGRAVAGDIGELRQLVPALRDVGEEGLTTAQVLEAIGESFGGRAQQNANTFSGSLAQISNAFGSLLEILGDAIIQNEAVRDAFQSVRDILVSGRVVEFVTNLASGFSTLVTEAIQTAQALARLVAPIASFVKSIADAVGITAALRRGFSNIGSALDLFQSAMGVTADESERAAGGLNDLDKAAQGADQNLRKLGDGAGTAGQNLKTLADQDERAAKAAEDASEAWERQVRAILEAEDAAGQLGEGLRGNREEIKDSADETDRFGGSIRQLRDDVFEYIDATRTGTEQTADYRDAIREAGDEALLTGRKIAVAGELARGTGGTSSGFGGTLAGGGSSLFPDSAIANTAIRDGRRVRVTPQGGRVVT